MVDVAGAAASGEPGARSWGFGVSVSTSVSGSGSAESPVSSSASVSSKVSLSESSSSPTSPVASFESASGCTADQEETRNAQNTENRPEPKWTNYRTSKTLTTMIQSTLQANRTARSGDWWSVLPTGASPYGAGKPTQRAAARCTMMQHPPADTVYRYSRHRGARPESTHVHCPFAYLDLAAAGWLC